jgi:NAD dependent epimerase/dehydratase family enzyme
MASARTGFPSTAAPHQKLLALLHGLAGDLADELLLGGQRVIPNKALSSGFVFRHETLRSAFEAVL